MNEAGNQTVMLEETGIVIAIECNYAIIEIQARSACDHCNMDDSCGTSVLSSLFSKRRNNVRLINHLNLSEGDMAVIGINESVLLSAAILAYMFPLIVMITFAIIINLSGFNDNIDFSFSLLGLFFGIRIINRIMKNKDHQKKDIILLRKINRPTNELLVQFIDE